MARKGVWHLMHYLIDPISGWWAHHSLDLDENVSDHHPRLTDELHPLCVPIFGRSLSTIINPYRQEGSSIAGVPSNSSRKVPVEILRRQHPGLNIHPFHRDSMGFSYVLKEVKTAREILGKEWWTPEKPLLWIKHEQWGWWFLGAIRFSW